MKPSLESPEIERAWSSFFGMFAWERSEPALRELDVGELDIAAIRPIAQDYLVESHATNRRAWDEGESERTRLRWLQNSLDATLQRIESEVGSPTLVRLLTLAESIPTGLTVVTPPVDRPAFYHWAMVLSNWPVTVTAEADIEPPAFTEATAKRFTAVLANWQDEEVYRLNRLMFSIVDTEPSDLERRASPSDPHGKVLSLGLLTHIVKLGPARALWRQLREVLTAEEFDMLVVWLNEYDQVAELERGHEVPRWRGLDDVQ